MKYEPKKIIAYGCSFTLAEETGDSEIYEQDEDTLDILKSLYNRYEYEEKYGRPIKAKFIGISDYKKQDERKHFLDWVEHCKDKHSKNSYVKFLADCFGCEWENRAIGGGSNEQALYRLYDDFCNNKISNGDLVIVGYTTIERMFWVTQLPNSDVNERVCVLGSGTELERIKKDVVDTMYNPYMLAWREMMIFECLINIENRLKKIGAKLLLLPILNQPKFSVTFLRGRERKGKFGTPKKRTKIDMLAQQKYDLLDFYLDITPFHIFIKDEDTEYTVNKDGKEYKLQSAKHGWGHPKRDIHKKYAEQILYPVISGKKDKKNFLDNSLERGDAFIQKMLKQDPFIYD